MAGNTVYKNAWQKEHMERINLTLHKGRKEEIRAHARAHGESVNGFINRAILETMEHDGEVDQIKRCAKEIGKPFEEAERQLALQQAVRLIDSQIPGFQNLYDSGQILGSIKSKIIRIGHNGSRNIK